MIAFDDMRAWLKQDAVSNQFAFLRGLLIGTAIIAQRLRKFTSRERTGSIFGIIVDIRVSITNTLCNPAQKKEDLALSPRVECSCPTVKC